MNTNKAMRGRGLSLRLVMILMFVIGISVSGVLLAVTYRLTTQYDDTEAATQDYLTCQENVYVVRDTIHDQNERARNFVVTGNAEEVIRYFNEVQVQRSIEIARENFQKFQMDDKTMRHLDTAIDLNEQMSDIQHYAMRLAVEGYEYDVNKYPEQLREVELTEEDLALMPTEQRARALDMLFAKDYTLLKGQVDIRISLCKDTLVETMNSRHEASSNELRAILGHQRRLVIGLVVGMALLLVFVMVLVVYPLHNLVRGIRSTTLVQPQGASELHFLAETYNQMYDQMEKANNRLSYEASHDALTGLFNRTAYEALREEVANHNIALLLLDVDLFKEVNDTYGHDVGDKVLVRVAKVLLDSFREADRICRIGGDEFCVIMMGATSSVAGVIRKKIAKASEVLSVPEDGAPAVTISVGCAFSDQLLEGESLFKNADRALYRVKQSGRNNCGFYHLNFDDDDTTDPAPEGGAEA